MPFVKVGVGRTQEGKEMQQDKQKGGSRSNEVLADNDELLGLSSNLFYAVKVNAPSLLKKVGQDVQNSKAKAPCSLSTFVMYGARHKVAIMTGISEEQRSCYYKLLNKWLEDQFHPPKLKRNRYPGFYTEGFNSQVPNNYSPPYES